MLADAVLCSEWMMVIRGVSDDDLNECCWAEDSRQSLWSPAVAVGQIKDRRQGDVVIIIVVYNADYR